MKTTNYNILKNEKIKIIMKGNNFQYPGRQSDRSWSLIQRETCGWQCFCSCKMDGYFVGANGVAALDERLI